MPYFETNRPPANGADPGDNTSNSLSVLKLLPVLLPLMVNTSVCRCACDHVSEPNRYGGYVPFTPPVITAVADPSPESLPPSPPADL